MTEIQNYLNDGANYQARATLMYLQRLFPLQDSWCDERKDYLARTLVARWENCREQGYVVSMRNKNNNQLNIAFFEHRNSDGIHAVRWEQNSINSLTIDTADFGDSVYTDKYDTSYSVSRGNVVEMADWIFDEFNNFWKSSNE